MRTLDNEKQQQLTETAEARQPLSPAKKRRKFIQIVVLALFVALCLYTVWTTVLDQPSELFDSYELMDKQAPELTLQGLDGKQYKLSDFRGQPVMLNFWASWCEPCRAEMPLLNKQYEAAKGKGLVVLGINLSENAQTVKGFVKEYKLTFPILLDNDSTVADRYGIDPIPSTFFVDKEGIVQDIHIGELDKETLDKYIKEIMP